VNTRRFKLAWTSFTACVHASLLTMHTVIQLLRPGELVPGLIDTEFAERREALADAMPADSVALLPAPPLKYQAGVVPYPYRPVGCVSSLWHLRRLPLQMAVICAANAGRFSPICDFCGLRLTPQEADIMYLTGVRQPGILAAISSARGSGKGAFTLFVPDASQAAAQWDGALLNNAAAEEVFGANAAFPMSQVLRCAVIPGCHGPTFAGMRRCQTLLTGQQRSVAAVAPDAAEVTSRAIVAAPLAAARVSGGRQGCPVRFRDGAQPRAAGGAAGSQAGRRPDQAAQPADAPPEVRLCGVHLTAVHRHSAHTLHIAHGRLNDAAFHDRWRKSPAELELMRKSAAIAASGLQLAMQRTHPGVFEFQIASTFGRFSMHIVGQFACSGCEVALWRHIHQIQLSILLHVQSIIARCWVRSALLTRRLWRRGLTRAPSTTAATTRWPAASHTCQMACRLSSCMQSKSIRPAACVAMMTLDTRRSSRQAA
jgi:hypothetical protein